MTHEILPTGNRLLVRLREDDEQTTASGLVIATTRKERPDRAIVLAVGPDVQDGRIQPGSVVVLSKFGGATVTPTGSEEKLTLLAEQEIIGLEVVRDV